MDTATETMQYLQVIEKCFMIHCVRGSEQVEQREDCKVPTVHRTLNIR